MQPRRLIRADAIRRHVNNIPRLMRRMRDLHRQMTTRADSPLTINIRWSEDSRTPWNRSIDPNSYLPNINNSRARSAMSDDDNSRSSTSSEEYEDRGMEPMVDESHQPSLDNHVESEEIEMNEDETEEGENNGDDNNEDESSDDDETNEEDRSNQDDQGNQDDQSSQEDQDNGDDQSNENEDNDFDENENPIRNNNAGTQQMHSAVINNDETELASLLERGINPNDRSRVSEVGVQIFRNLGVDPDGLEFRQLDARLLNANYPEEPRAMQEFYQRHKPGFQAYVRALRKPTPLHLAAALGRTEMVKTLLDKGADVNSRMSDNYTPLILAVLGQHTDTCKQLLQRGADVNITAKRSQTALHYAARSRHMFAVTMLLLHRGANPNAQTISDVTPIHLATEKKLPHVVSMLLTHGADVNSKTVTGITPLHIAAKMGATNILDLLLERGADMYAIIEAGQFNLAPLSFNDDECRVNTTVALTKHTAQKNMPESHKNALKALFDRNQR